MRAPLPESEKPAAAQAPGSASAGESPRDLREERDRFVGFAFAAADLLLEVSSEDRILFAAGAAKALTGAEVAELTGKSFLGLIVEPDRALAERALNRARAEGRIEPVALTFAGTSGAGAHATVSGCLLPEKGDSIYLAIVGPRPAVATTAITGARDVETGLLDGESFDLAAIETLGNAKQGGQTLELALLRLKGLDDLQTRTPGNSWSRLLSEIGTFLRSHSVGGNTAGRLDSDKFGLIRSRAAAKIVLGNEIERLARAHDPAGKGLRADETGVDLDMAGITSDDAAKALAFTLSRFTSARNGDFSIKSLAQAFRTQISETVSRISHLKSATDSSKMRVAYQPIVEIETRLLHHYEMLVRFERNKSPFEMIQFAEKVGMIEAIDLAMCQRAIDTLHDLAGPPVDLAVNISGRSLDSDIFVEALMKLLEPHAKLSRQILFEITESNAMSDLQRGDKILTTLRKRGYRICLDDFGAGASSFPYLQALSLDFVKIDGSYVGRMRDSAKDRAIIKAMVAMCQDLRIGLIAEMVERVDQAEELHRMGIAYAQGFLFGHPSPTLTNFVPVLGNAPLPEKTLDGHARRNRS